MPLINSSAGQRIGLKERLELSATVLLIAVTLLVGGLTVWDRVAYPRGGRAAAPEPPLPKDPVSIEGARIRGDRDAKVALIEFSDFECPYCGNSAREVMPEINHQYVSTGKVLYVWRHYPLPIHKHAKKAAEAAECAGRQGQFWTFHDWAFVHQRELEDANLLAAAGPLHLDERSFAACLDGQAAAKVQAEVDLAKALSIGGTPEYLIGVVRSDGRVGVTDRLTGAGSFASVQKVIEKVISRVESSAR